VKDLMNDLNGPASRRSFMKKGLAAAGTATVGAGLLGTGLSVFGQESEDDGPLTKGDVAILRFLAAAEIIESDLWQQYNELGGIQDDEAPGGSGSAPYTAKLLVLDGDMSQYIHDNTNDEFSHQHFLNAYLVSKGEESVNLDRFRTLPSSKTAGTQQIGRLTNLLQLNVDTSNGTRYRSSARNPDLDPNFKFPQAIPGLFAGQFPAIPRTDADLSPDDHIEAIASTAGFHFGYIEQGGSSLYPTLAQKVTNLEVLRVLLSIGPTETAHFQTWHDKAGNAPPLTDPTNGLVFPNLNAAPFGGETFQTNLIMPEPTVFLNRKFPAVSIIRPTSTEEGGAVATINSFTQDGLFIGQSKEFFELVSVLAREADASRREL